MLKNSHTLYHNSLTKRMALRMQIKSTHCKTCKTWCAAVVQLLLGQFHFNCGFDFIEHLACVILQRDFAAGAILD